MTGEFSILQPFLNSLETVFIIKILTALVNVAKMELTEIVNN